MSLFGKLKTAVMGNPVTREFELGKHVASAGPGLLWKVHNGVKKTSRQVVSIFVFDKKSPELEKLSKKQKEALYEMLKKVWCVCFNITFLHDIPVNGLARHI